MFVGMVGGLVALLWGTVSSLLSSLCGLVTSLSLLHWTFLVILLLLATYHIVQVNLSGIVTSEMSSFSSDKVFSLLIVVCFD